MLTVPERSPGNRQQPRVPEKPPGRTLRRAGLGVGWRRHTAETPKQETKTKPTESKHSSDGESVKNMVVRNNHILTCQFLLHKCGTRILNVHQLGILEQQKCPSVRKLLLISFLIQSEIKTQINVRIHLKDFLTEGHFPKESKILSILDVLLVQVQF